MGVVVPSLWEEGFGLGAREARACGLPVMASRIGGLEQLDSDPGVTLVEPGDHGAWVAAIQKVQKGLIQPQTAIKSTLEMTEEVAEVYAAVLRERTKRAA
jgi:glycosyltransferase involved in cell wall biosynthesis